VGKLQKQIIGEFMNEKLSQLRNTVELILCYSLLISWGFFAFVILTITLSLMAMYGVNELILNYMAITIFAIPLAPYVVKKVFFNEQRTKK